MRESIFSPSPSIASNSDGVEAIFRGDPQVLTFSLHESGRTLFPGTGGVNVGDEGPAVGTTVNLPLFAGTGAEPWLAAVHQLVPPLRLETGRPDFGFRSAGAVVASRSSLSDTGGTRVAPGQSCTTVTSRTGSTLV